MVKKGNRNPQPDVEGEDRDALRRAKAYKSDSRDWLREVIESEESANLKFLPSPKTIAERAMDLTWLQMQGFDEGFIKAVMHKDKPPIRLVRQLRMLGYTISTITERLLNRKAGPSVHEKNSKRRKTRCMRSNNMNRSNKKSKN